MKTLAEIKNDILSQNPSKVSIINGETIELTAAEFADAVQKRAEMEFEQIKLASEEASAKEAAESKLLALGLTIDDLKVLGLA